MGTSKASKQALAQTGNVSRSWGISRRLSPIDIQIALEKPIEKLPKPGLTP
jgi:hypothetical protein